MNIIGTDILTMTTQRDFPATCKLANTLKKKEYMLFLSIYAEKNTYTSIITM